jgi:hypothetical protein
MVADLTVQLHLYRRTLGVIADPPRAVASSGLDMPKFADASPPREALKAVAPLASSELVAF